MYEHYLHFNTLLLITQLYAAQSGYFYFGRVGLGSLQIQEFWMELRVPRIIKNTD